MRISWLAHIGVTNNITYCFIGVAKFCSLLFECYFIKGYNLPCTVLYMFIRCSKKSIGIISFLNNQTGRNLLTNWKWLQMSSISVHYSLKWQVKRIENDWIGKTDIHLIKSNEHYFVHLAFPNFHNWYCCVLNDW